MTFDRLVYTCRPRAWSLTGSRRLLSRCLLLPPLDELIVPFESNTSVTSGIFDALEDCAELLELYHSHVASSVFFVAHVEYHA